MLKFSHYKLKKLHPTLFNQFSQVYLSDSKSNKISIERKVPSNVLNRVGTYGSLFGKVGLKLAWNRLSGRDGGKMSLKNSPEIIDEIVKTMCKLRGAALKFGQMLSVQDNAIFSDEIQEIFERVRQNADFMPFWQVDKMMSSELGTEWKSKFKKFDPKPFAAASIGQVHKAVLGDDTIVAVKVQYPGIANSIAIDLQSLSFIIRKLNILPESFFLDNSLDVARKELMLEVDFQREAEKQMEFRDIVLNRFSESFYVPKVYESHSSQKVLTSEFVNGSSVDKLSNLPQNVINDVCKKLIYLTLQELFVLKYMQTDPNWSNFLYDPKTMKINLIDFGACRNFSDIFVDDYIRIIRAAVDNDLENVKKYSLKIKFLTGFENNKMINAHIDAVTVLGLPFKNYQPFDFKNQNITHLIGDLVPTMLKYRMTPPPDDTYSLHRKMSGVFLLAAKLGANISCKDLFEEIWSQYKFSS